MSEAAAQIPVQVCGEHGQGQLARPQVAPQLRHSVLVQGYRI